MEQRQSIYWYLQLTTSALSLAACMLVVGLWVRSYWIVDSWHGSISSARSVLAVSLWGRTAVLAEKQQAPSIPPFNGYRSKSSDWLARPEGHGFGVTWTDE